MSRRRGHTLKRVVGGSVVVFTLGFMLLPLLVVIPLSFEPSTVLKIPPTGFSLRWYEELRTDERWQGSGWLSFQLALLVALLSVVLGLLAAVGMNRYMHRGRSVVRLILIAPLVVPVIISAIAMYDQFLRLGLARTFTGLAIAHTVIALPYVVIIMEAALGTVDPVLEEAAMSMGSSRFSAFTKVTLPQLIPSVIAAGVFAFLQSWDEVVIAIFMSAVGSQTLPLLMFELVQTQVRPTLAAASTLLIAAVVLPFVVVRIFRRPTTATAESEVAPV